MKLEATILVEPVAKQRPRIAVFNGHGRAYTPAKTRNAEALIKALIREQVRDCVFPAGMPLKLSATFFLARPQSLPKKYTMPTKKPDLDNLLKTLLDALNKYAFADDAQITSLEVKKRYGTPPRIELTLEKEEGLI